MKIKNEPAFPCDNEDYVIPPDLKEDVDFMIKFTRCFKDPKKFTGIAKRELAAMFAMMGYNTNQYYSEQDAENKAQWCVQDADALLEALEKKK